MNGMTITEQRKTTMRTSITRRSFLGGATALGAIASGGMNARAIDAAFNLDFTDAGGGAAGQSSVILFAATAVYAGEAHKGATLLYGFS